MRIDDLIAIVQKHKIDAVHPGYGFLSESEAFAERMWEEAGAVVIGPGWQILASTGDKLKARQLAERCMECLTSSASPADICRQRPGISSLEDANR